MKTNYFCLFFLFVNTALISNVFSSELSLCEASQVKILKEYRIVLNDTEDFRKTIKFFDLKFLHGYYLNKVKKENIADQITTLIFSINAYQLGISQIDGVYGECQGETGSLKMRVTNKDVSFDRMIMEVNLVTSKIRSLSAEQSTIESFEKGVNYKDIKF